MCPYAVVASSWSTLTGGSLSRACKSWWRRPATRPRTLCASPLPRLASTTRISSKSCWCTTSTTEVWRKAFPKCVFCTRRFVRTSELIRIRHRPLFRTRFIFTHTPHTSDIHSPSGPPALCPTYSWRIESSLPAISASFELELSSATAAEKCLAAETRRASASLCNALGWPFPTAAPADTSASPPFSSSTHGRPTCCALLGQIQVWIVFCVS